MLYFSKKGCFAFISIIFHCFSIFAAQIIISRSGFYRLGEDIEFNPSNPNDTAISIQISDVTLDLDHHIITQQTNNTQANIDGITVEENLRNITIQNGVVRNLTGRGLVFKPGDHDITVQNIITVSCDHRGIDLPGIASNPLKRICFKNCDLRACCQGPNGDFVVFVNNTNDVDFIDVKIRNNGISTNDISALRAENSIILRCINVDCLSNKGIDITGFQLLNVQRSIFENCLCIGNESLIQNGLVIGVDLVSGTSSNANIFRNCESFGLTSTQLNGTVIGFRNGSFCNDNNFIDCMILENAADGNCTGMMFQNSEDSLVLRNLIKNNISQNGVAAGCLVSSCTDFKLLESIINETMSFTSTAIGIDLQNSFETVFRDNIIRRSHGFNDAISFGIRKNPSGFELKNVFIRNIAIRNGVNDPIDMNQYAGISGSAQQVVLNQNVNSISFPFTNSGFI